MDAIQRQLEAGEQMVFRTRLHAVALAGTAGFAAFVLGTVALIVARNELAGQTIRLLWLAGVVVIVLGAVPPYLRWRAAAFAVTSQRVIVRLGLRSRHMFMLPLAEVTSVAVERPLGGRLLGYGTLRVATADGGADAFSRVARPEAFRDALLGQLPGKRRGRERAGQGGP
jgi:uncharacterized membrane protein YdbT with pleckstrin-like domain